MHIQSQPNAIHVVGIELRTTNAHAMQTIPKHWQRFAEEAVAARLCGDKPTGDVYAVYTNFENAGSNNEGLYSLVIGVAVDPSTDVPPGMTRAVVPVSMRAVFPVEAGRFDLVGPAWQIVWARHDLRKTYIADCERYRSTGEIDLSIGIERDAPHA